MQLDKSVEGVDRAVVLIVLVVGEGGHKLCLRRPDRIGVLALHLVELLGGGAVVPGLQLVHGGVVNVLDRAFDVGDLVVVAAAARRNGERHNAGGEQAGNALAHGPRLLAAAERP